MRGLGGISPQLTKVAQFAPKISCQEEGAGMEQPDSKGLTIEPVGNGMDCCGMGGNFGFKAAFHEKSLDLGRPLMEKIRSRNPDAIVTDCLSCRLQFGHTLPYTIHHPIELLAMAYADN